MHNRYSLIIRPTMILKTIIYYLRDNIIGMRMVTIHQTVKNNNNNNNISP